jgi:hypothetical protein
MNHSLEDLQFLIGKWYTEGEVLATRDQPAASFRGTDTYEWVLDRKFIMHKVNVHFEAEKVEALELIHQDRKDPSTFILTSFDNRGTITTMAAQISGGERLLIAGNGMRAVLTIGEGDKMHAFWEKSEDNEHWNSWMKLELAKGSSQDE